MFEKFLTPHYNRFIRLGILLLVLLPFTLFAYLDYQRTKANLTELTLSRRESLAELAAIVLKEKFDRFIDLGISFATRVQFRKLIEIGKWDEAIKILESAPKDFPYIDTVALFDVSGTIWAVTPSIPEVIGQNFAHRDYYKGVSKNWQPYVSEVFKRAPEPRYNVVSIAVPIRSDVSPGSEQKILGMLLLTIKLDTTLDWARGIEAGDGGFTYFVDRNGNVAGHPKFFSRDEVVNFSEVPVVKKVLRGEQGVEISYNQIEQEERLSAYKQVPGYGWGVIVQQPTLNAFLTRNTRLRALLINDAVAFAIISLLLYFILSFIKKFHSYHQKEQIVLKSIGDGLIAIDRYWNITLWNDAAKVLTGWREEEAMGKPFREIVKFIRDRDKSENITFIEETMLFGKPHMMENNTQLVRKDGTMISVGDSASPIFDENNKVSGAIIIFRDVSKEREVEKMREEFTSLASHQLRGPVTVIKGYASLLLDEGIKKNDEERQNYLQIIQGAGSKLNELVNAILNISRIESGVVGINPEPAYVPDIADAVFEKMAPQIKSKNLTVQKKYGDDLPSISVDVKLTEAVLENLISNAVKYTPPGGKISADIEKKENDVLIKISDTGYGIPRGQQSKIFSRFFRADNIGAKETEGTGLGLYIVKSIVDQAGGRIWFESEENKGTAFYVAIPLEGMKKKEGVKGLS